MRIMTPPVTLLMLLALSACQTMAPTPDPNSAQATRSTDRRPLYGVVTAVEVVRQENQGIGGTNIGLGAIAGAVIGGVVGNQIGSGTGNTVATVAGVAGGAVVGHALENRQQKDAHKVTVRFEDGSYQALMLGSDSGFRAGDRVRLDNGVLQRY